MVISICVLSYVPPPLSFAYSSFPINSQDQPSKQFICIKSKTTALNILVKPAIFGAVIDGLVVTTPDFESGDPSSKLGRTSSFARKKMVTFFLTVCGYLPPHFFNFFDFLISYHSTCQYRSNIIFAVSLCFCFAVIEGN